MLQWEEKVQVIWGEKVRLYNSSFGFLLMWFRFYFTFYIIFSDFSEETHRSDRAFSLKQLGTQELWSNSF